MTRPDPPADPSPEPTPNAPEPVPTPADAAQAPEPVPTGPSLDRRLAALVDPALRVVGGLVVVVAAVVTAALELIFSALRLGGPFARVFEPGAPPLIGVSVVLAVVGNVALAWFAHRAVGRVWAVALPAVAWFVVMLAAASRTTEGDILLAGNWVGLGMIFAGSLAFAVMAYRLILATDAQPPGP